MADIIVNDINPRVQYTAAGGQTVFAYTFPIFANTDLIVYRTPVGQVANDVTQVLTYITNYTVTNNVAPAVGGTITLNVGATAGDIITIVRDMPQNRLNNYLDGGQWSATQFNTDFDRTVMMSQTDKMYARVVAPHYNSSAQVASPRDTTLPLLTPLTSWRMNSAGTALEAFAPQGGGGGGIGAVLPTTPGNITQFADAMGTVTNSIMAAPVALPLFPDVPLVGSPGGGTNFDNNGIVSFTIQLTAADLLGMYAAPIVLPFSVPAANTIYVIHAFILEYQFVTTPYTVPGGAQIVLQYGNAAHGAGPLATANMAAAGLMDQGASTIAMVQGSIANLTRLATNQTAIYISNTVGALTVGDGTAELKILYSNMSV